MLLTIGFTSDEINRIKNELNNQEIYEIPEQCEEWKIEKIVNEAQNLGGNGNWHDKKFILMHGLGNEEVKEVLGDIKTLGFENAIFATTTPTSMNWNLNKAIDEWIREHEIHKKSFRGENF